MASVTCECLWRGLLCPGPHFGSRAGQLARVLRTCRLVAVRQRSQQRLECKLQDGLEVAHCLGALGLLEQLLAGEVCVVRQDLHTASSAQRLLYAKELPHHLRALGLLDQVLTGEVCVVCQDLHTASSAQRLLSAKSSMIWKCVPGSAQQLSVSLG